MSVSFWMSTYGLVSLDFCLSIPSLHSLSPSLYLSISISLSLCGYTWSVSLSVCLPLIYLLDLLFILEKGCEQMCCDTHIEDREQTKDKL